jgi:hypothetical protein
MRGASISRTGERADRDGTVDDLCEGVFRLLFHPAPARPESYMSGGHVDSSRRARADQFGLSAHSQLLERAAHRGEYR